MENKMTNDNRKTKGKTPASEIRFGNVTAIVWKNQSEIGTSYSVKLNKIYVKDGEWFKTDSFGKNDIIKAQLALQEAARFIFGDSNSYVSENAESTTPVRQYN